MPAALDSRLAVTHHGESWRSSPYGGPVVTYIDMYEGLLEIKASTGKLRVQVPFVLVTLQPPWLRQTRHSGRKILVKGALYHQLIQKPLIWNPCSANQSVSQGKEPWDGLQQRA